MIHYAAHAIAPNTRRTYHAGEARYISYCNLRGWTPYPATDIMLSCFAAFLASSVCPGTINVYLSAVRNLHVELGYADPLAESWLLKRVMKGITRCLGSAPTSVRLPITMPILRRLVDTCRKSVALNEADKCMYQAAMLSAFFGFLRCGEFTGDIKRSDVKLQGGTARVFLATSKTDPLRKGVTIVIGSADPPYCAVRALLTYLTRTCRRAAASDPLFTLSNGQRLTRQAFTATVRTLLASCGVDNFRHYSSHSFRIGAATTAAAAGVTDSMIRAAGRWKSDACLRYIRTSDDAKADLARKLVGVRDV